MIKSRIINFADFLIDKYGTNDPFTLCDELNIEVNSKYLGNSIGYYTSNNGMCVIYINKAIETLTQKAVCAHELGHALIHTGTNIRYMTECTFYNTNRYEREANIFAANLLLNNKNTLEHMYDGFCYSEIAVAEGVPIEFIKIIFNE